VRARTPTRKKRKREKDLVATSPITICEYCYLESRMGLGPRGFDSCVTRCISQMENMLVNLSSIASSPGGSWRIPDPALRGRHSLLYSGRKGARISAAVRDWFSTANAVSVRCRVGCRCVFRMGRDVIYCRSAAGPHRLLSVSHPRAHRSV